MHINGGCFCGAITFETEIEESRIGVCHCRDCQILSGSAFRMSAAATPGSVKITKGTPASFEKPTDSGNPRRLSFCDKCGTHLFAEPLDAELEGAFTTIRLAACDQFDQLTPVAALYCDRRVSWLPEIEGTISFPKMPG